jgi:hypothetical protein
MGAGKRRHIGVIRLGAQEQHPLGAHTPAPAARPPYDFLPVEGEALHQIPVGPVHQGTGYLLPTNLRVCVELRWPAPDFAKITRMMLNFFTVVATQGRHAGT